MIETNCCQCIEWSAGRKLLRHQKHHKWPITIYHVYFKSSLNEKKNNLLLYMIIHKSYTHLLLLNTFILHTQTMSIYNLFLYLLNLYLITYYMYKENYI